MQVRKTHGPKSGRYISAGQSRFYGDRLRCARHERGLSAMNVFMNFEYIGSVAQLKDYERGKTLMNGLLMYRFCILYKKDIREFFLPDYDGRYDSLSDGRDCLENEYELQKKMIANIIRFRRENGISLSEMAERIGVRPAALCQYEKGKRIPVSSILCSMCEALGMSVFELFGPADTAAERKKA